MLLPDAIEVNGVVIKTEDFTRIAKIKNNIDEIKRVLERFAACEYKSPLDAHELDEHRDPELRLFLLLQIKYLIQKNNITQNSNIIDAYNKSFGYKDDDSKISPTRIYDALSCSNKRIKHKKFENEQFIIHKEIQELINKEHYRINSWKNLGNSPTALCSVIHNEQRFFDYKFIPDGNNSVWKPNQNEHNQTIYTNNSAQYGNTKQKSQFSNYYGAQISPDELDKIEQKRRDIGTRGEALINDYFNKNAMSGEIKRYTWMRAKNYARSSFDFEIFENDNTKLLIEVKSSNRDFFDDIYISFAEIKCMADQENYYLYRVYELSETGGMLRIAQGMRNFAQSVLDSLDKLPPGVHVDSFSVEPKQIESYFGKPIQLLFSSSDTKNS